MPYVYPYDDDEKRYQAPKLQTNRSLLKLVILSILTLGIYSIVFFYPLSLDLDKVDPKRDREKTMNYLVAYILSFFTVSIVITVWHYHIARRIEEALDYREIDYNFKAGDFWKWYFFGSLILVGPIIYFHKLCTAMNLLCKSYNEKPVLEKN